MKEVRRNADGVRVFYSSPERKLHSLEADYCICTLPLPILRALPADFSSACRQALRGMPMVTQYKIGWQSPRFWEREYNIYGGMTNCSSPKEMSSLRETTSAGSPAGRKARRFRRIMWWRRLPNACNPAASAEPRWAGSPRPIHSLAPARFISMDTSCRALTVGQQ